MRAIRIAFLLGAISASAGAFAQTVDYSLSISQGGVPLASGEVVYALVVTANWSTDVIEPFVVRLTVPPELEPPIACNGEAGTIHFDPITRVLTWSDHLDNPYISMHSCPLRFRVDPSLAPGSTYSLAATLETPAPDPNPGNNVAALTSTVLPASDLVVQSSSDVRRFKPGATVTYTFTVTNYGPHDAHDVTLVDQLAQEVDFVSFQQVDGPPASVDTVPNHSGPTCYSPRCGTYVEARLPVVPDRATATFRLVARAKSSFEAADISNRVFVHSTSVDLFDRNNDQYFWTFAGPNADLALTTKRMTNASSVQAPITIEVSNDGPETVNSVMVENALNGTDGRYDFASNVKFLSVTPSQGTCSAPDLIQWPGSPYPPEFWTLHCALGALASGGRATIIIVIEKSPLSGPFQYSSLVTPAQNDSNTANNQSELNFTTAPRGRAVRK